MSETQTFGNVDDLFAAFECGIGRKNAPGTFATGKGTTARILAELDFAPGGRTAEELGQALAVPGRQLSKRLAEQVKRGTVFQQGKEKGKKLFFRVLPV